MMNRIDLDLKGKRGKVFTLPLTVLAGSKNNSSLVACREYVRIAKNKGLPFIFLISDSRFGLLLTFILLSESKKVKPIVGIRLELSFSPSKPALIVLLLPRNLLAFFSLNRFVNLFSTKVNFQDLFTANWLPLGNFFLIVELSKKEIEKEILVNSLKGLARSKKWGFGIGCSRYSGKLWNHFYKRSEGVLLAWEWIRCFSPLERKGLDLLSKYKEEIFYPDHSRILFDLNNLLLGKNSPGISLLEFICSDWEWREIHQQSVEKIANWTDLSTGSFSSDFVSTLRDSIISSPRRREFGSRKRHVAKLTKLIDLRKIISSSFGKFVTENNFTTEMLKRYSKRLERELRLLSFVPKAVDLLIETFNLLKIAKDQGAKIIGCRGSAVSSLIVYLLGLSYVDPVAFRLMPERFFYFGKLFSLDIDIDIPTGSRENILSKVNKNHLVELVRIRKLRLQDLMQKLGVNLEKLLNLIFQKKLSSEEESGKRDEKFVARILPLILNRIREIFFVEELSPVSFLLISDLEILFFSHRSLNNSRLSAPSLALPEKKKVQNRRALLIDRRMERFFLQIFPKMDILSSRKLDFFQSCLTEIERETKIGVNLKNIPLDDPGVLGMFKKGKNMTGIFQFDTDNFRSICNIFSPERFEDLVLINAFARPGARPRLKRYLFEKNDAKGGSEEVIFLTKFFPSLKETLGQIVFEEQLLSLLHHDLELDWFFVCRFLKWRKKGVGSSVSSFRHILFKQITRRAVKMQQKSDSFPLFFKQVIWRELVEKEILHLRKYLFNRAHAIAYSILSYWFAYLKFYFPRIFFNLLFERKMIAPSPLIFEELSKNFGFCLRGPRINCPHSLGANPRCTSDRVLILPLPAIGVRVSLVGRITEAMNKRGKFVDIFDFCRRIILFKDDFPDFARMVFGGFFDPVFKGREALIFNFSRLQAFSEICANDSFFPLPSLITFIFPNKFKGIMKEIENKILLNILTSDDLKKIIFRLKRSYFNSALD